MASEDLLENLTIADLDAYDIATLFTLSKKSMMGYDLRITKPGGFWPILITELFIVNDLSEEHIIKAINKIFTEIHQDFFRESKHVVTSHSAEKLANSFIKKIKDSHIKARPGVKKGLISIYDKNVIYVIEDKYAKSIQKLEEKGLITDDYEIDNLVSLTGNVVEPYNEITEKGNAAINNISKMMEEEEGKRMESVSRLLKFLETFLNEFMMNVSIR
jgi:hypothetical protein